MRVVRNDDQSCMIVMMLTTITMTVVLGAAISASLWLARWTNQPPEEQKEKLNLWICLALSLLAFLLSFCRSLLISSSTLRAAQGLHSRMLVSLLRAPVRFFDTNPSGRILNRFSKSVGDMDEFLPEASLEFLRYMAQVCSSLLLVSIVNPWLLFASVPLAGSLSWLAAYFLRTSREVKRLESISCSPLYGHVAETINGVVVVRACSMEKSQIESMCRWCVYLYVMHMCHGYGVQSQPKIKVVCQHSMFANNIQLLYGNTDLVYIDFQLHNTMSEKTIQLPTLWHNVRQQEWKFQLESSLRTLRR